MYKNKPLLRKGNLLYYGNHDDKYIIAMHIEDKKLMGDLEVATLVRVCLQTNDAPGKERIVKKAERDGLWKALDLSEFWLNEALKEK